MKTPTKQPQLYTYCVYDQEGRDFFRTCAFGIGYAINDRASVFVVTLRNGVDKTTIAIPPKGCITLQKYGSDEVRVLWKEGRDRNYVLEESNVN